MAKLDNSASVGPILDSQPRDQFKVLEVPGNQHGAIRQNNRSDEQVPPTDLFQPFDLSKSIKFDSNGIIDQQNREWP